MQYSLKSLFVVTFIVALFCAVFFAVPAWLCIIILGVTTLCLPGVLIGGIVYGKDNVRAFSIGASPIAIPSFLYFFYIGFAVLSEGAMEEIGSLSSEEIWPLKISYAVFLGLVIISGFTTVGVRYLLTERKEQPPLQEE